MAMPIRISKRTDGDGMESTEDLADIGSSKSDSSVSSVVRKLSSISINSPPKEPVHNVVHLKPVASPRRKLSTTSARSQPRSKGPKFVPYEPYKAAVRPIVPLKKGKKMPPRVGPIDARQRNISCSSDYKSDVDAKDSSSVAGITDSAETIKELERLREENIELEKQLKFQAQINGELKNLLVAAVGEDMEVRVNSLTEDKLHLAQALLNSAKTLSTHQEQVEWLASQCEVWRSKFLASSVMVEELARWKAALSQRITDNEEITKQILEERRQIRKTSLQTFSNLCLLRDNFNLLSKRTPLKTSNILELSAASSSIVSGLVIQLLGTDKGAPVHPSLQELPHSTEAEKAADYLLKNPHLLQLIGEPDAACSAVVGAAVALNGQLFRQSVAPHIACCPQCTGKVKML